MRVAYPDLKGKVAVVTGASRGIGRAVALRLAGCKTSLVLNHLHNEVGMQETVTMCKEAGAKVDVLRADVGHVDTAPHLCQRALERFGQLDIVVNNAGVVHEGLLAMLKDEKLEHMLSVNIRGLVRMTRAALRPMLRQGYGSIVNLSSALATRPGRGNAVYAGTKGFVEAFTRSMAVELGRKQIRVNAVAPGVIDTDMTRKVQDLAGELLTDRIAMKRLGTAEEVAQAVVWLASEEASHVSGSVLAVDGAFLGGA